MLCRNCEALDFGQLIKDKCTSGRILKVNPGIDHRSQSLLEASAARGCGLCLLFVAGAEGVKQASGISPSSWSILLWHTERVHVTASGQNQMVCFALSLRHTGEDYTPLEAFYELKSHADCNYFDVVKVHWDAYAPELWLQWMKSCDSQHDKCSRPLPSIMPTRLIYIGDGVESPRLVEAASLRANYVALSYCWGRNKPIVTTMQNYSSHLDRISIDNIPPLFNDAMNIARDLNIDYLWIDSLCIIQDDVLDWQRECTRMHDVYGNSAITIAADFAVDAFDNIPTWSHDCSPQPCTVALCCKGCNTTALTIEGPVAVHDGNEFLRDRLYHTGPLAYRAWAVQERLLAPRILHFGRTRVFYECNTGVQFDTLCDDKWSSAAHQQVLSKDITVLDNCMTLLARWYELVERYSRCSLTEGDDRLPAISGLAEVIGKKLNAEYLAGLWTNDLIAGLLWRIMPTGSEVNLHLASISVASWSWVSVAKPIEYALTAGHRQHFPVGSQDWHQLLSSDERGFWTCADAWCTYPGTPAEAIGGRMSIRGHVLGIRLQKGAYVHLASKPSQVHRTKPSGKITRDQNPEDDGFARNEDLEAVLLSFSTLDRAVDSSTNASALALALQPVTGQDNTYRRVGLIEFGTVSPPRETIEHLFSSPVRSIEII